MATVNLSIAGREYKLAPLNLKQIRQYLTDIPDGESPGSAAQRSLGMIAASLANADPSQPTAAQLEETLDLEGFAAMVRAVLQVSGLAQAATGEPQPAVDSGSTASTAIS